MVPRANRYYQEGLVFHLTHRCNHRYFLLKRQKDKERYRYWLHQACRMFRFSVLNYVVTDNHVHLLVYDTGGNAIADSMCLIASRVAYENHRRLHKSNGAFWQGRYFATAVQNGVYLLRCMQYIDMNMVRCGVVRHPKSWRFGGYYEWRQPRQRYRVIDEAMLLDLLDYRSRKAFLADYDALLDEKLMMSNLKREPCWTEAVAVGDSDFVSRMEARTSELSGPGVSVSSQKR